MEPLLREQYAAAQRAQAWWRKPEQLFVAGWTLAMLICLITILSEVH